MIVFTSGCCWRSLLLLLLQLLGVGVGIRMRWVSGWGCSGCMYRVQPLSPLPLLLLLVVVMSGGGLQWMQPTAGQVWGCWPARLTMHTTHSQEGGRSLHTSCLLSAQGGVWGWGSESSACLEPSCIQAIHQGRGMSGLQDGSWLAAA